jgi:phosphoserine phosphatase
MRAHGARCALVSGGFTFFTGRVAERLGFHEHYSNTLLHEAGRLTGQVGEPILGRNAKLVTLKRLAAEEGLDLAETLAVGDGANDLDMLCARCCLRRGIGWRRFGEGGEVAGLRAGLERL